MTITLPTFIENVECPTVFSDNRQGLRIRFHYERGIEHFLFVSLIVPRLKSKRALSETENTPFHARSGNEP